MPLFEFCSVDLPLLPCFRFLDLPRARFGDMVLTLTFRLVPISWCPDLRDSPSNSADCVCLNTLMSTSRSHHCCTLNGNAEYIRRAIPPSPPLTSVVANGTTLPPNSPRGRHTHNAMDAILACLLLAPILLHCARTLYQRIQLNLSSSFMLTRWRMILSPRRSRHPHISAALPLLFRTQVIPCGCGCSD